MFENIIQSLTGGDSGNVPSDVLHGHLDSLLGAADSSQASGAFGDALGALGASGFGNSVQSAAQSQSPAERGQLGSLLLGAIQHGGGDPSAALNGLGIGTSDPQGMSAGDLGALASHVAENHGGALAGLLGGVAGGGAAGGSGGSGIGGDVVHLLGNQMVQQTAMNLAKRFL